LAQATLTLAQYSFGLFTTPRTSRGPVAGMNTFCQKMLCFAALAGSATAAYTCSDGYSTKAGAPSCATAYEAGCSKTTCCTAPKKCSAYSVAWIVAQAANGGCHKDSNKAFFDKKKLAMTVASPQGDADITAACCTPYSSAKCSDWVGVHVCATGTSLQNDKAAAPDGTDGKSFSAVTKFREACCVATPKTCASYSVAWMTASLLNGGCLKGSAKDFFDKKKMAVTVASPHGDTQVKAACCTPFSSAKCSDWVGVHSCAAGTSLQKDNAAAPDGTDGKSFTALAKFQEKCCVTPPTPPKKCSDHSVAWILAQAANAGCHKDSNKAFFDKKKLAMTVASPQGEADIKAACCTPYSLAKCSDWVGVHTCATGMLLLSTDAAAPDGSDGKTFSTLAKFRQVCCKAPLKCSAYTGKEMASGGIMHAASLWVALAGVVAMWVL